MACPERRRGRRTRPSRARASRSSSSSDGVELRRVHGMIAEVHDLLANLRDYRAYRLRIVPRAFRLTLVETTEISMNKAVPDLIQQKLELVGLSGSDVELRLSGSVPAAGVHGAVPGDRSRLHQPPGRARRDRLLLRAPGRAGHHGLHRQPRRLQARGRSRVRPFPRARRGARRLRARGEIAAHPERVCDPRLQLPATDARSDGGARPLDRVCGRRRRVRRPLQDAGRRGRRWRRSGRRSGRRRSSCIRARARCARSARAGGRCWRAPRAWSRSSWSLVEVEHRSRPAAARPGRRRGAAALHQRLPRHPGQEPVPAPARHADAPDRRRRHRHRRRRGRGQGATTRRSTIRAGTWSGSCSTRGAAGGVPSRPVRMLQNHAGANYGTHFPLEAGGRGCSSPS